MLANVIELQAMLTRPWDLQARMVEFWFLCKRCVVYLKAVRFPLKRSPVKLCGYVRKSMNTLRTKINVYYININVTEIRDYSTQNLRQREKD